ncbi:hypothetical protein AB1E18_019571 [Capra hircus]
MEPRGPACQLRGGGGAEEDEPRTGRASGALGWPRSAGRTERSRWWTNIAGGGTEAVFTDAAVCPAGSVALGTRPPASAGPNPSAASRLPPQPGGAPRASQKPGKASAAAGLGWGPARGRQSAGTPGSPAWDSRARNRNRGPGSGMWCSHEKGAAPTQAAVWLGPERRELSERGGCRRGQGACFQPQGTGAGSRASCKAQAVPGARRQRVCHGAEHRQTRLSG